MADADLYSYLTFKATRQPRVVQSGLPIETAIADGSKFYDHAKLLSDHGLLASGVCVLVVKDDEAERAEASGALCATEAIAYQCGGF